MTTQRRRLLPWLLAVSVVPVGGCFGPSLGQLVADGNLQEVKDLLQNNREIAKNINEPEAGIQCEHEEEARSLYGDDTYSPIVIASFCGHYDIVEFLATQPGIDLQVKSGLGRTPLMIAAQCDGHPDTIRVLLKSGADPNVQDNNGQTALMHAIQNYDRHRSSPNSESACYKPYKMKGELVELIVESGAKLNIRDRYGATALNHQCGIDGVCDIRNPISKYMVDKGAILYDLNKRNREFWKSFGALAESMKRFNAKYRRNATEDGGAAKNSESTCRALFRSCLAQCEGKSRRTGLKLSSDYAKCRSKCYDAERACLNP